MPIGFLVTALLTVSVITNLTVEGIKKLLNGTKVKYSSNVLAAILSILIACAVSVIYLIMTDTVFTMKIGVEIIVLMYMGFLVSTVGYDKVIQMLKQLELLRGSDLLLRHISHHLAPSHFAHGSLFDDPAILFFSKNAGDKANRTRQVFGHADAVLLGSQIENAVRFRKKSPGQAVTPIGI